MVLSDEVQMGVGLTSFVVRKEAGFPQMKIDLQDMGKILVSLSETKGSGANSQILRYKPLDEISPDQRAGWERRISRLTKHAHT